VHKAAGDECGGVHTQNTLWRWQRCSSSCCLLLLLCLLTAFAGAAASDLGCCPLRLLCSCCCGLQPLPALGSSSVADVVRGTPLPQALLRASVQDAVVVAAVVQLSIHQQ
jgi:hypothetical protein